MVNSCKSGSPILLDTPERPTGVGGNSVIEIPDTGSSERNHTRRRRLEPVDDVVVGDSSKRARMEVPVIDLTTDNEEEPSTADINAERLLISMHNSPRYAELRARFFPDEARLRIRRAISLRHRATLQHPRSPRHQVEERPSSGPSSRTDAVPARTNQRVESIDSTDSSSAPPIVVDDDDVGDQSNHFDLRTGFSRPSCSRVRSPRMPVSDSSRPTLSPTSRNERSRSNTHSNVLLDCPEHSDVERRNSRRDTIHHLRTVRRNQRRQRHLREQLGYISPFTNYSVNSDESFARSIQSVENEAARINNDDVLPSSVDEAVPQRLIRRTPPAFPLERPYDIPDLLLPAVLSWWGPDSRLRHFGDPDDEREDYEALWSLSERLGQGKAKGLSKTDLEGIPAFRYSAASKDSSNGSCVVCMMNYSNKEKLRRLPCNHDFHAKCIDRWFKNNRSCPVCRKDVTTK